MHTLTCEIRASMQRCMGGSGYACGWTCLTGSFPGTRKMLHCAENEKQTGADLLRQHLWGDEARGPHHTPHTHRAVSGGINPHPPALPTNKREGEGRAEGGGRHSRRCPSPPWPVPLASTRWSKSAIDTRRGPLRPPGEKGGCPAKYCPKKQEKILPEKKEPHCRPAQTNVKYLRVVSITEADKIAQAGPNAWGGAMQSGSA